MSRWSCRSRSRRGSRRPQLPSRPGPSPAGRGPRSSIEPSAPALAGVPGHGLLLGLGLAPGSGLPSGAGQIPGPGRPPGVGPIPSSGLLPGIGRVRGSGPPAEFGQVPGWGLALGSGLVAGGGALKGWRLAAGWGLVGGWGLAAAPGPAVPPPSSLDPASGRHPASDPALRSGFPRDLPKPDSSPSPLLARCAPGVRPPARRRFWPAPSSLSAALNPWPRSPSAGGRARDPGELIEAPPSLGD